METSTIVFVCGVISCILGIATFVTGMVTRARNDGKLEAKLGFCLQGIEEIKTSISSLNAKQTTQNNSIIKFETEITTLKLNVKNLQDEYEKLREKVNELEK